MENASYDYDLIVIGGGSGGMSCAKTAANLGAKVLLFDFVKPSTQNSTWGLGGTCVNVGCVPKKLMHYAGLLGQGIHDAKSLGWKTDRSDHDWDELVGAVKNHVKMLNFRYRVALKNSNVTYINALAEFNSANSVTYNEKNKTGTIVKTLSASYIVIAVGGRPFIPRSVKGAYEYAITSDDIFTLSQSPGKTLCVGGSYIALECAGFLTELGYEVTVAARSILLRGFDNQCAGKIGSLMSDLGTNIMTHTQVISIVKLSNGKLEVTMVKSDGTELIDIFDTVLYATGRVADLAKLNLSLCGVVVDEQSGKIPVINEQTNMPNIFAVGDVCEGKMELTPVAVKAGELLAKRLFGHSNAIMNYSLVATTVFTPFEYGMVGMTEEEAIGSYGEENIEIYCFEFTTLELSAVHRTKHVKDGEDEEDFGHCCLSKLICLKSQNERVIGFHFIGPNAGEITQGFALSIKLGATKSDFDDLVGIHPTDAESFCSMTVTKRSGLSFAAVGGCGGGVCG
eukprot:gene5686-7849_t